MVYSQADVKALGSILGIWAHPDDEAWASAGLMKMAAMNGQKLGIITATKGDAGKTADPKKWPQEKLAQIREGELHDCLCEIDDNMEQFWLDYKDGGLQQADQKAAVAEIQEILERFQPDTVVTFEHYGLTGHDDHQVIHLWSRAAVEGSKRHIRMLCAAESKQLYDQIGKQLDEEFDIFFNTDKPRLVDEDKADLIVKLDKDVLACKMRCLRAHASQTSHFFAQPEAEKRLQQLAATECYTTD